MSHLHAVIAVPFQGRAYVLEVFENLNHARACARTHRQETSEGASIEECDSEKEAEMLASQY